MEDKEIKEVRKLMGTYAQDSLEIKTTFWRGVEGIEVKMVDWTENPYRAIYDMVTATWGDEEYSEKWQKTKNKGRKLVLEAALTHQTLTSALEAPKFTFLVKRVSRSSFDQIARVRIGAGISSQGVRDNSRIDAGFRIPRDLYDNLRLRTEIEAHVNHYKRLYKEILEKGHSSWQSARSISPMGMTHNFYITINYLAFQNQCARRLQFCEQPDTVAAFWLMRKRLGEKFPVLAAYCRPMCDLQSKCGYHKAYTISEMFSCLFKACGRWPVIIPFGEERKEASYFDFPSCTREELMKELEIPIWLPNEWEEITERAWKIDNKWMQ